MELFKAPKHDWHLFDAERHLEVRQTTNRLRANRWEVRDATRRMTILTDEQFDRLRSDPDLQLFRSPGDVL